MVAVLVVAAHAAALVLLAPAPVELAVALDAPPASLHLALAGEVPPALAARVATRDDGDGPGLHRRRWSVTYRGDHVREVGASQLVGPFQDPAHPPCAARVVVGQRLLDAAAPIVARALDDELAGEHVLGVGDFRGARDVSVRWAQLVLHAGDIGFAGAAGAAADGGYIRVTATLAFERAAVPVVVALVPAVQDGRVALHAYARASLEVGNRVLDWLAHRLGGDRLVSALARRELDASLVGVLAPPPPFAVPGGGELRFVPCGVVAIRDGELGALGFAVAISRGRGNDGDGVLPALTGAPLPPPRVGPGVALALDFGVDALDALLYELWRAGVLDRELARVGLDRQFAADPTVAELLSVRLSPVTLALPPAVTATPRGLRLAADARLALHDGDAVTAARVYGALTFAVASPGCAGARSNAKRCAVAINPPLRAVAVDVDAVELACERDRGSGDRVTLVACYTDLVDALRGRADAFHGALTDAFTALLAAIFVDRRIDDAGLPAAIAIDGATPSITDGTLHLDVAARLVAR